MSNRERAEVLTASFGRSDWKLLTAEVELALDKAIEEAAERALSLMTKLNTDYRHEIVDAIRGAK